MERAPRYTVSINPMRMLVSVMQAREVAPAPLLKKHGIAPAILDDLEARVPLPAACAVWDNAAVALGDPSIGLTVGAQPPIGEGLLAYAIPASDTVGDALRLVARFHRLIMDVFEPRIVEERGRARFSLYTPLIDPQLLRQLSDLYLAKCVYAVRTLTDVTWNPLAVRFRHAPPKRLAPYRDFFRAPLTFDHALDELEIDRALLRRRVRNAQPRLLQILDRYAAEALARLPPANDFVLAVRYVVATSLRNREPSIERIAKHFHVSARTLQRRLAERDLSLSQLIDDARHELAMRYFARDELSIAEIALLLGFNSQASFYRVCRRWTGVTPGEWRRRLQLEKAHARR